MIRLNERRYKATEVSDALQHALGPPPLARYTRKPPVTTPLPTKAANCVAVCVAEQGTSEVTGATKERTTKPNKPAAHKPPRLCKPEVTGSIPVRSTELGSTQATAGTTPCVPKGVS
jgi:hypothetical protein